MKLHSLLYGSTAGSVSWREDLSLHSLVPSTPALTFEFHSPKSSLESCAVSPTGFLDSQAAGEMRAISSSLYRLLSGPENFCRVLAKPESLLTEDSFCYSMMH